MYFKYILAFTQFFPEKIAGFGAEPLNLKNLLILFTYVKKVLKS